LSQPAIRILHRVYNNTLGTFPAAAAAAAAAATVPCAVTSMVHDVTWV
jgi:hypothetical protein